MTTTEMTSNKVYQYITTAPKAAAQRILEATSYRDFIDLAAAAGVKLTRADVETFHELLVTQAVAPANYGRELSDAELNAVAGGASVRATTTRSRGETGSGTQYQPLCDILPPPTSDPFLCGETNKTVFQPGCP